MEISIIAQLLNTLASVILGSFIGLIYEAFGILRVLLGLEKNKSKIYTKIISIKLPLIDKVNSKTNERSNRNKIKIENILYFLIDFIFFLFITPIILIFIYATSNGIVRWYIFVGCFIGFLLYYYTVRRVFNPLIHIAFYLTSIIIRYLWHFIKIPFKKLTSILSKSLISLKLKIKCKLKKIYNKISKKIKSDKENEAKKEKSILFSYGKKE